MDPRLFSLAFILFAAAAAFCQEEAVDEEGGFDWRRWINVASPEQVEQRLGIDALPGDPLISLDIADEWREKRADFEQRSGVRWSVDYISAFMRATESPGEDKAASGALRFFGRWRIFEADNGTSGALVWKVEHRHAYANRVAPQDLGFEAGYLGLPHLTLSDQRGRLSNLYWRQRMRGGDLVFIGGWVDTSDYMDVYTLASPWTAYFNYVFSTGGASIPVPNEGLGLAAGGYLTDKLYIVAGVADNNSDPHRPWESIEHFFGEDEYFSHIDIGWNSSEEALYLNNFHLTFWHSDRRVQAAVAGGWGGNFSWSRLMNSHWTTYIRGGYSEGGGAILKSTFSTGVAWSRVPGGNQLAIGYNWGEPSSETWGESYGPQTTVEMYYRMEILRDLSITPDLQYIRNPAQNPDTRSLWIPGIRLRLEF